MGVIDLSAKSNRWIGNCFWVTGLAGSGKSTLAEAAHGALCELGIKTVLLDGDAFREILGSGAKGYSKEDRLEVAFQISRLCKILTDQGIDVVCATISLFKEIHDWNSRNLHSYFEIFVDVPMDELINRDKKGLYSGAMAGAVKNVVGVDIPFDKPKQPDLHLDNSFGRKDENILALTDFIKAALKK